MLHRPSLDKRESLGCIKALLPQSLSKDQTKPSVSPPWKPSVNGTLEVTRPNLFLSHSLPYLAPSLVVPAWWATLQLTWSKLGCRMDPTALRWLVPASWQRKRESVGSIKVACQG